MTKRFANKTAMLQIRIDEETKAYLQRSAEAYGTSMSSLVLANIKQTIRTGDMYLMLPEHFKLPTDERRENSEALRAYWRNKKRSPHPRRLGY